MPDDKLPARIQNSILAALVFANDDNGALITNLVEPETFDQPIDDFVYRCLEYRKQFKRPPGRAHIDDLVAHVLDKPDHKQHKQYTRIVEGLLDIEHVLDTAFVLSKISDFTQVRKMRIGISQAVERYSKGGEGVTEDLQAIFRECLKIRQGNRDYGFRLSDEEALGFLNKKASDLCPLGIAVVDECGCVPTKSELLVFMASRNKGKSQFAHHCGKYGALQGWTVFHYTLENLPEYAAQRYYQTMFSGVKRDEDYWYAKFSSKKEDNVRLRDMPLDPNFIMESKAETLDFLEQKRVEEKAMLRRIRIRQLPTGKPTFAALEKDLDEIELVHKQRPDMLIIDSPQLMRYDRTNAYAALGELYIQLRGLAIERNLAVVATHQGNRKSETASTVVGSHMADSIDVLGVADNVLTYSQTASEEEKGLARLFLAKVRNDRARGMVQLTQHYASAQFAMDSMAMTKQVKEAVDKFTGKWPTAAGEEDEEAEAAE